MSTHRLDVPELHRRLDTERRSLGLSWRGVGRQTGLPPSTFSRISKGRSIEADALVSLLVWLNLDDGLAAIIEPGQRHEACPHCGRNYQPNRDGSIRQHNCPKEPQ